MTYPEYLARELHRARRVAAAALAALALALTFVAGTSFASLTKTTVDKSGYLTRAPYYASGAWTALDVDTVTAASATLTADTRYVVQCTTDHYMRFGTAASAQAATSSNGYLPAGAWLEFATDDSVKFVSVLGKTDGVCYFLEAR